METEGLLSCGALALDAFNTRFLGILEIVSCRRKNQGRIIYICVSHNDSQIFHKPEHQNYGTVKLTRPYLNFVQPDVYRIHVGRATMSEKQLFSIEHNVSLGHIPELLLDRNNDASAEGTEEVCTEEECT